MAPTPIQWMLMPLRRFAQFRGRAARAEYWWFWLVSGLVGVVALMIYKALAAADVGPTRWLPLLLVLPLDVPLLAVSVRRLHDIGRSGWWAPLPPVLIYGFLAATAAAMTYGMPTSMLSVVAVVLFVAALVVGIVVLIWHCTPGTAGPNRFGDDPLRP